MIHEGFHHPVAFVDVWAPLAGHLLIPFLPGKKIKCKIIIFGL
jgi:hypothetical protein